jgi:hypothetical protein
MGGVAGNTLRTGIIKASGGVAVILLTPFFLKTYIFNSEPGDKLEIDPPKGWFPVEIQSGIPIDVTVKNGSEEREIKGTTDTINQKRANHAYQLFVNGTDTSTLALSLKNNPEIMAGSVDLDDIQSDLFFNKIRINDGNEGGMNYFKLYQGRSNENSTRDFESGVSLPFELKTHDRSKFTISDENGNSETDEVRIRYANLYRLYDNEIYIIVCMHADSRKNDNKIYSEWLVGKLKLSLED